MSEAGWGEADVDEADGGERPLATALLTWEYPPSTSGLPRAAREIAQSLAGAGHDVRVVTLDREGVEHDGAVEVHGARGDLSGALRWLRRRAAVGHLAAPLAFRAAIARLHARRALDVVEATNWHAPGVALARLGPVPLVTRCSTPADAGAHARASWRERIDGGAVDRLEAAQARGSAGLISNTAAHRERVRAAYGLGGEGERDRNGAPHHAFPPAVDPALVQRGAAAPHPDETGESGPVRFLFVGRPDRRKGFDAIAEAVRAAPPEASWHLDLVGTAPDMLPADLREGPAARRLTAHGRVPDDRLTAMLERTHAVLAPSRSESFGYVYQEALAYGRPLVACAEDASARQHVGEPGAGLLAETCTGEAVGGAIARLADDRALRLRLRERALGAAGGCTPEASARNTARLYRAALRRVRAGKGGVSAGSASSGSPGR